MSTVTKPIVLDETAQAIKNSLDVIANKLGDVHISGGKFYGYKASVSALPSSGDDDGYAYVGTAAPYAIYNATSNNGTLSWVDSGSTISNLAVADEEDIDYDANGKLQLANRVAATNQKGYKILRKDASIASQMTDTNTIYEVRYAFDLDGGTLTIPSGCALKFNGGKIYNGTISATRFEANEYGFDNVTINGYVDFTSPLNVSMEKPKEFVETILAYKETTSLEPTVFVFSAGKTYSWEGVLNINKKNVSLIGGGTIEGTIHLGLTASEFNELNYGAYPRTAHSNYIISGLRFSKYGIIGTSTDSSAIGTYIKNAEVTDDNTAISLINVCHVKISDCFFDNVPYPIVYKPNATFVNQNVRRLNITNCDFEYCHTGIYAPSVVKSSIEYGDMIVANCNFFASNYGIDCECIDGFKVFGCTFNTGVASSHPCSIKAYLAGQVVISHNSFYGENNDCSVILDTPGNAEIVGNLFSSISTSANLVHIEKAAFILRVTGSGKYCTTASVIGNQFNKVDKPIMILLEGDIRSFSIDGNSMTLAEYSDSRKLMWRTVGVSARANCLQPIYNSNQLETQFDYLRFYLNVARDVALIGNRFYYPNKNMLTNTYKYYNKDVKIASVYPCAPIFVISFNTALATTEPSDVEFVFNGKKYSVSLSKSLTKSEALSLVIDAISNDWGDTYKFKVIGNLLWIVGKSSGAAYTPFYTIVDATDGVLSCKFQTLGSRLVVCDTDGKGFINPSVSQLSSSYYGIDEADNGKRMVFNGKSVTLYAKNKSNVAGKLYFRSFSNNPTTSYSYILMDNGTFFGVDAGVTDTASSVISEIVDFAYSDLYTVNGNKLNLIATGEEFYYVQQGGFSWYWTWDGHVADYQFLSDDGRIYNFSTDSFNDVGTTANRPNVADVRKGFVYYDETIGKSIVSNGTNWVNMDGSPLISTSGSFANAPTPTNVGFQYFCTSGASIDGGTTEKTNIVIYYTGSGWVDANGNAVVAKA